MKSKVTLDLGVDQASAFNSHAYSVPALCQELPDFFLIIPQEAVQGSHVCIVDIRSAVYNVVNAIALRRRDLHEKPVKLKQGVKQFF